MTRDVNQTYSDLYIDYHVKPMRRWARARGLNYRAQPYGLPIDIAQAAGEVDVPECENFACGRAKDDWRMMAGGGDPTGTKVISDEYIPGIAEFASAYTLGHREIVEEVNEQYELGANQMVFANLPYPHWPPSADGTIKDDHTRWPGFHPWGATFVEAFGERQPTWTMTGDLSGYLARTQLVLQRGVRRTDVAVYNQSLDHITNALDAGALTKAGFTYGYLTPGSLTGRTLRVKRGRLALSGPAYRALIVADQESMPLAAAKRIDRFAASGLPVIVIGAPPSRTPGYAASADAAAARDADLRKVVARLLGRSSVRRVASVAEAVAALASIDLPPAADSTADSVRTVRRVQGDTQYYYVYNASSDPVSGSVSVTGPDRGVPYSLDAWTGTITPIAEYRAETTGRLARFATDVTLGANEATILAIGPTSWLKGSQRWSARVHATDTTADAVVRVDGRLAARAGERGHYVTQLHNGERIRTRAPALPDRVELTAWDLTVDDWRPARPGQPSDQINHVAWTFPGVGLQPWSDVPEIADASGIGTYSTTVTLPAGWRQADGAYLDLGAVGPGSFRVKVNGEAVGVPNQHTGVIDLRSRLTPGENEIEVTVATTLINRVRVTPPVSNPDFADREQQRYGLLGPVTLAPYVDMPLHGKRRHR